MRIGFIAEKKRLRKRKESLIISIEGDYTLSDFLISKICLIIPLTFSKTPKIHHNFVFYLSKVKSFPTIKRRIISRIDCQRWNSHTNRLFGYFIFFIIRYCHFFDNWIGLIVVWTCWHRLFDDIYMSSLEYCLIVIIVLFRCETVRILKTKFIRRTFGKRMQMMNTIDNNYIS